MLFLGTCYKPAKSNRSNKFRKGKSFTRNQFIGKRQKHSSKHIRSGKLTQQTRSGYLKRPLKAGHESEGATACVCNRLDALKQATNLISGLNFFPEVVTWVTQLCISWIALCCQNKMFGKSNFNWDNLHVSRIRFVTILIQTEAAARIL